jgi:hypothetical protein
MPVVTSMASPSAYLVASGILAAACHSPEPTAGAYTGSVLGSLLVAVDDERAPRRCLAEDLPPLERDAFDAGKRKWQTDGHELRLASGDATRLTIGVIADASGATPATLAALGRLRKRLDERSTDVLVVLGGMADTRPGLEAVLGVLADRATFAIVALPGDLEGVAALTEAIGNLRQHGVRVVDGRLAQHIELTVATISTIPGAGALERLAAGTAGCTWQPADVTRTFGQLQGRPELRIAASSEAPREHVAGEPTGELALVPAAGSVDVLIHGPTHLIPSPARVGHRDGTAVSLSPGTADAEAGADGVRVASAGVLVIDGSAWTWQPLTDSP